MSKRPAEHRFSKAFAEDLKKRFGKLEGINYKRGAVEYASKLDASNRYHLYTKPFYNLANKISRWSGDGLDEDTQRHFCDFASMAYTLALPAGARILDVGCGSGWLCEYFARLGYAMTGIDLSPELIAIAQERVRKVPYGLDHQSQLNCRFLVHDIESAPLSESFDAIICYDALHHFENEHAVLANLNAMLDYGGQLFVMEGEKPSEESATGEELRHVMQQYETLESPFDREYLLELMHSHGFAVVGDYTSVRGFVDRENFAGNTVHSIEPATFNYLLCKNISRNGGPAEVADSRHPDLLRAEFSLQEDWPTRVLAASNIEAPIQVTNTGNTLWLVSSAPLSGRVRVGLKILNASDQTIAEIHGTPPLQRALAPGEKVLLRLNCRAPDVAGNYTLKVDLVNQNICWFEQRGSKPLLLSFEVIDS